MIFVPTRKVGERVREYLRGHGLETPFYHSQFGSSWDREQLLKRFVGDGRPIVDRIICTSAFGIWLDVPNVRLVIHWQHPSSVEDYLQEFGRAGRNGKPFVAVLLHTRRGSSNDIGLLDFMAKRATENAELNASAKAGALAHKRGQIQAMARLAESPRCFRQGLTGYFTAVERRLARVFRPVC